MGWSGGCGKKEKSISVRFMSWVPGEFKASSGGYCTESELTKKGSDEERESAQEECDLLFKNLFRILTLCSVLAKWVQGLDCVANASDSASRYSSCLKMILCLVQFKLCAE